MNFDLNTLLAQIVKSPARTKLVVLLSIAAIVGAIGISGWISGQPHFVKLYSDLPDAERVAVEKALAGGNIRYRVSDFPGPFVIYVDDSQYDQAQIAVALGEALKTAPKGIESGASGASSIFMSAGERNQTMNKREWQEAERLLECLEFVADATVTTSMPDPSPLRERRPVTVSVALELKGAPLLSQEQASNIAKLVRYRFGVPAENIVIADQTGRTLYDPSLLEDHTTGVDDIVKQSAKYDTEVARKANEQIERAYGPRKVLVSVVSEWDNDQMTKVDEKVDPESVATQIDSKTTQTPQGSTSGAAGFGSDSLAVSKEGVGAASAALAKTTDEKKTFETSRSRTQTVRSAPVLKRLSVSLVLDESLSAKKDEIQKLVEAAVGYDAARQDTIAVSITGFVAPPALDPALDPSSPEAAAAVEDKAPSPMVKLLLERGVEIVSALAFLVLLVTSIKGGKKAAAKAGAQAGAPSSGEAIAHASGAAHAEAHAQAVEIDPDALARAQIEELVRTDPRRVGEILSRWVDDKSPARAGR